MVSASISVGGGLTQGAIRIKRPALTSTFRGARETGVIRRSLRRNLRCLTYHSRITTELTDIRGNCKYIRGTRTFTKTNMHKRHTAAHDTSSIAFGWCFYNHGGRIKATSSEAERCTHFVVWRVWSDMRTEMRTYIQAYIHTNITHIHIHSYEHTYIHAYTRDWDLDGRRSRTSRCLLTVDHSLCPDSFSFVIQ